MTNKKTEDTEATVEATAEVDEPVQPTQTAEEVPVEEEPTAATETTPVPEPYQLPPALADAGLHGVMGLTSGQYTLPSGSSFSISPGQTYAVSAEDADALVEQGAAVSLEDTSSSS